MKYEIKRSEIDGVVTCVWLEQLIRSFGSSLHWNTFGLSIDLNVIALQMTYIAIEIKPILDTIYETISDGLFFSKQNKFIEVSDRFFGVANNWNAFVVSVSNVVFIHILLPEVYHIIGCIDEFIAV